MSLITISILEHFSSLFPFPGIVQYFPDNQNKALFRQRSVPDAPKDEVPRAKATGPGYEEEMKNRVFGILPQPPESPSSVNETSQVSYNVHIFYYTWYANKAYDGAYQHWNHKYLPNWDRRDRKRYPKGPHDPDHHDIGASFYPELGCYSSRDPKVMATHMKQIRKSGAGVVVVSWYPPGLADENGLPSDAVIEPLLNAAHSEELKIALLIEPYNDLNVTNLKTHLEYVRDRYWSHPAFYKRQVGRRQLPVFYVYDSYRVDSLQWQRLLSRKGDVSVRDTTLDAIFLGLLVEFRHRADIKRAKFDGFFTYFASNGFSHGSSWKNWKVTMSNSNQLESVLDHHLSESPRLFQEELADLCALGRPWLQRYPDTSLELGKYSGSSEWLLLWHGMEDHH